VTPHPTDGDDATASPSETTDTESAGRGGRRRGAVPFLAAAGIGVLWLSAALAGGEASSAVTTGAGVAAGLAAAVSLLFAASSRFADRRAPGAWRWLTSGTVMWILGTLLRPVAEGTPFVLTFADLLMPVASLLLAIGVGVSVRPAAYTRGPVGQAIDAYLAAGSVLSLLWVVLLGHAYTRAEEAGTFFVTLAPSIVCLLSASSVAPAVLHASRRRLVGVVGLGVLAAVTLGEFATALARLDGEVPPLPAVLAAPAMFVVLAATPWAGPLPLRRRPPPIPLGAAGPLLLAAVATVATVVYALGGSGNPVLPVIEGSIVLVLLGRLFVLLVETAGMRDLIDLGDRQLRQFAESTGDLMFVCDLDGVIKEVAGVATYGHRPADLVNASIADYLHPEDVPAVQQLLQRMAADEDGVEPHGSRRIGCRFRAADGTWRPTESVATRHVLGDDLVLITVRDLSDQVALRNQVTHLTFHDGVTGLPNRSYFEERVREALDHRAGRTAVIFVDLDGFTAVNDSVGHASGDYLLGQAARRLRSAVGPGATLARWGGDEFAVLVEGTKPGDAQVIDLAERLVRAVSAEPFRVADRDVALTASVGVAFDEDGQSTGDLLRNADVAMSRAKELGGRRVEIFATHMHASVLQRLELASDLQRAVAEKQFTIEYQPVVDLETCNVTAVEALVRWWRGSTFVPPEKFLGIAEETGVIVSLSEWILREACREVVAWRESGWDIGLSVNLSARQINDPRFVEKVAGALEESGLPPGALTLEVVEEMLVAGADETMKKLAELRSLGVRLAIDDFGTGYASLASLRQIPVDMIKIDPSFVSGLGRDETLTLLTRTIVRLGHDLGLVVVAEGIERPEQLELLREMGCPRGQGYLVSRPMAARRVDSLRRIGLQSTA